MRKILVFVTASFLFATFAVAFAQYGKTEKAAPPATQPHSTHVIKAPTDMTWGAPPPVFESGAQFTVLTGDPGKAGAFTVRLKMPAGYKINPHWHPTDEHVTVISGTFKLGMGDTFNEATMTELPAGGYAQLPAQMRHYAMAKTEVIVQVHGTGPFKLTYVNPADDPIARASKK
jgi:quercetin dioxygenase-like cupin family protein